VSIDAGVRVVTLTQNLWDDLNDTIDYGDVHNNKYRIIRYIGCHYIDVHRRNDAVYQRPLLTVHEPTIEMG